MPPGCEYPYFHDYDELVTKGSPSPYGGRGPHSKVLYDGPACLSKTLHDPFNTLSKKERKRLLRDDSDGLCPGVEYSLNKHNRWEMVNPSSLLLSHQMSGPEVLVVKHNSNPRLHCGNPNSVKTVYLVEDDEVTSIAVRGKGKSIRYFTNELKQRRGIDKKEVEPARFHLNIIAPQPSKHWRYTEYYICMKQRGRLSKKALATHIDDGEVLDDPRDLEEEEASYMTHENISSSSTLTLGDFLTSAIPSTSSSRKPPSKPRQSGDQEKPKYLHQSHLVNISKATKAPCIFETFDVNTRRLKPYVLDEMIERLVPERFVMKKFDTRRISIANQSNAFPEFVVFFEVDEARQQLRIRLNANARYRGCAGRTALLHLLKSCSDFEALFNQLVDFVLKLDPIMPSRPRNARYDAFNGSFGKKVNSRRMSVMAERCRDAEQLQFVREQYCTESSGDDWECVHLESKCSHCLRSQNADLFTSTDGFICSECASSSILRQMRLNHFPLQIPVVTSSTSSPLDLLYAILPMPVMSLLLKMSFFFYHSLSGKEPFFTQCPECSLRLVVKNTEESDSCICPDCQTHWCYKCYWEPHWPMNCEEFHLWSDKWDQQYATEQFLLDDAGEQVLRLTCACKHTFYVLESEAQGARCPNGRCTYRYDTTGLLRDRWDFFVSYSARDRKRYIDEEGKMAKKGTPVHPEIVSPVRSIRKEFAELCARSRNLRFNKEKMTAFASSVSKGFCCESRQKQALDARKTVLLLVEHVTAWLYLHRDRKIDVRHMMIATSKLFEQLLTFEQYVLDERENLDECVDIIDEDANKLMMLVRRAMQKYQS